MLVNDPKKRSSENDDDTYPSTQPGTSNVELAEDDQNVEDPDNMEGDILDDDDESEDGDDL